MTMPALFRLGGHLGRTGRRLVVIQLSGGNDGLNTFVPVAQDAYFRARRRLALSERDLIPAHDELAFHPSLAPLKQLYDEGMVSIVNSVGYPEPSLSHFRALDIWHSGSSARDHWTTGWLGRWLDRQPTRAHRAIQVDNSLSLALRGEEQIGFALRDPESLHRAARSPFLSAVTDHHQAHAEQAVSYLYQTLAATQESAGYLIEQTRAYLPTTTYPSSPLGRDLRTVAQLLCSDTGTRICYASMTGFDTHVNQAGNQARLLKQYAEAVAAFVKDLRQHGILRDTLILTFSEFGRRVAANASDGTDHGTANAVWLIGQDRLLHPGFVNGAPDLENLDAGNLRYQVDFRQIYAEILERWLDASAPDILGVNGLPVINLLQL